MRVAFSLCQGAGLRICESCRRLARDHPKAAGHPHQPWIPATTSSRCPHWLSRPAHAITPTDKR